MSTEATDFRRLVKEKGRALRLLPYEALRTLSEPTEAVRVGRRNGRISIIVELCDSDARLKVVVQGFLDGRWLRRVKSVGLDGFYKDPNGLVTEMRREEFYDYD